jgi:hypothetical protein
MGYLRGLPPTAGVWRGPSRPAARESGWFGWVLLGLFAQAPWILAKYFFSRLRNRLTTARENGRNTATRLKGDN